MIYLTSLAPPWQYVLCTLLFLSMLALLVLCIYKYRCRQSLKKCLAEGILFCGLLAVLSYCSGALFGSTVRYEIKIPYFLIILLIASTLCLFAIGLRKEYNNNKKSPNLLSLRQALDNLDSGVCFADSTGRIILINRTMVSLISGVLGSSPQMLADIEQALSGAEGAVEKIPQEPELYRFENSGIWSFDSVELSIEGLEGFVQISAHEVTEIYLTGEGLKEENEQLQKTNAEIGLMLERLADRIREQETLKLKARIHDDIGTSLIEISNIIEGKHGGDMGKQLAVLQNAVSYFSNDYSSDNEGGSLAKAAAKAAQMGAELIISGDKISSPQALALACSAANECVTNAIKHADGNAVYMSIKNQNGEYFIEFTNNGNPPSGIIKEGGGLSALRRSVEAAGGEMIIISAPEFKLQIRLRNEV